MVWPTLGSTMAEEQNETWACQDLLAVDMLSFTRQEASAISGVARIWINILQSQKQERDCLVHFIRLLAVCWPGARSARDNQVLACNLAKYSPILIFFHSHPVPLPNPVLTVGAYCAVRCLECAAAYRVTSRRCAIPLLQCKANAPIAETEMIGG